MIAINQSNYPREYKAWTKINYRCENPKYDHFHRYGGRGIKVCERWRNSFQAFFEDMGPKPSLKHSIDRIDNDGDYCPENCRWATHSEQTRNRDFNRMVTVDGLSLPVSEWSERTGLPSTVIYARLNRGWSDKDAVNVPARVMVDRCVTLNGETKPVNEWSVLLGIPRETICGRIRRGWPDELVLSKKIFTGKRGLKQIAAEEGSRSR